MVVTLKEITKGTCEEGVQQASSTIELVDNCQMQSKRINNLQILRGGDHDLC